MEKKSKFLYLNYRNWYTWGKSVSQALARPWAFEIPQTLMS